MTCGPSVAITSTSPGALSFPAALERGSHRRSPTWMSLPGWFRDGKKREKTCVSLRNLHLPPPALGSVAFSLQESDETRSRNASPSLPAEAHG